MKVVVTGGAGFIGANLVHHLAADGDIEVVVVDDLSTGRRENLVGAPDVRLLEGSILDEALLEEAVEGAAAVVHLAARPSVPRSIADPVASHEANVDGTVTVLEVARRRACHVVLASSSSVYGATDVLPKHEGLPTAPRSPYAAGKLAAESYALAYGFSFDLPVLAFRFFNVFGPLQPAGHAYAAVVPAFVEAALARRPIPVHGDGKQTRDFTYVGSVVNVLAEAVRRRVVHEGPVNLAFGTRQTLLDVVAQLQNVLGRELVVEHGPPRPGDVRDSMADSSRLRSLFPDSEAVEFADGLRTTVEWFQSTGMP